MKNEQVKSAEQVASEALASLLKPWTPRFPCRRCAMNTTRRHSTLDVPTCERCEDLPAAEIVHYRTGLVLAVAS